MTKVGVFGAGGRMGRTVCAAVAAEPTLELVAAVDPYHVGIDLQQLGVPAPGLQVAGSPDALVDADAAVAVDFTVLEAAYKNLEWCAEHGIHAVVGTTGFTAGDLAALAARFEASTANAVIAPNFSIGAVLMMRFAEMAAPLFDSAEVVEMHHDEKVDAPSGTALLTAERMAAASGDWSADPTEQTVLDGARGGEGPAGIRVHSLRLRGLVAHQEVILGTTGQTLTIRHDSFDRSSFMPGVVLAVQAVADRPGLTVGLDTLLGL
ncbi:MAG TPA: 4-hydroxy-tetrahydrodipicolinate reductase [Acidimicrobiia bacterium]|nr:4-hydroxy-tetrahydrodipicolinate reductase [Acidimicrobiia bacterium]